MERFVQRHWTVRRSCFQAGARWAASIDGFSEDVRSEKAYV
jgi:hypothetical protein